MHTTGIRARLISVISCAIPPRSPLLIPSTSSMISAIFRPSTPPEAPDAKSAIDVFDTRSDAAASNAFLLRVSDALYSTTS